MSVINNSSMLPMSSGEIPQFDVDRAVDIENKQQAIADFLEQNGFDAVLLQEPSSFAWFTSGATCVQGHRSDPTAALFLTPDARVLICSNTDSGKYFDRDVAGLGFQLKERPWHEPRQVLIDDICRGRNVASDRGFGQTHDASHQIANLRLRLSAVEQQRIKSVGATIAHALEACARNISREQTEAEVAGAVAHRLIRHQVVPESIQVAADGRNARYRNWSYGNDPIRRYCVISVVGQQHGLHAAATRTVCFGEPPQELRARYQRAALVQSTGMFFSVDDWEMFETWNRIRRIYEKFSCSTEWTLAPQAEVIGYEPCEVRCVPKSEFRWAEGMAVFWHPSVGQALLGDTMVIEKRGIEIITPSTNWPYLEIAVKGTSIIRPDILRREP